ncbi:MAG TPA: hypothetical protein VD928_00435, partial [Candidatus Paceibacterota bacterium]|nr:hypothetical protein [Candidatus Paceibacterota bacterium]
MWFAILFYLVLVVALFALRLDGLAYLVIGAIIIGIILEALDKQKLGDSTLARYSAARLRDVAARYQILITGKAGNTWDRVAFFGLAVLVVGYGVWWLMSLLPVPFGLRWLLIFGAMGFVALILSLVLVVPVPKLALIIVTNRLTGRQHVLIPSFNFRYPWETFNRGRIVTTEAERSQEHSDVLSQRSEDVSFRASYLSANGIRVNLENPVVMMRMFAPLAPVNISHSEESVEGSVSEVTEGVVMQEITSRSVEDLRKKETIDAIEDAIIAT